MFRAPHVAAGITVGVAGAGVIASLTGDPAAGVGLGVAAVAVAVLSVTWEIEDREETIRKNPSAYDVDEERNDSSESFQDGRDDSSAFPSTDGGTEE